MKFHLAQVNIAKMKAPIDHPVMAEFVANLDYINSKKDSPKSNLFYLRNRWWQVVTFFEFHALTDRV